MRSMLKYIVPVFMGLAFFVGNGLCQDSSNILQTKVDAVISEAYQSVSSAFPCKLKAGGKPKMLSWQGIEKCYFKAYNQINWDNLAKQIKKIKDEGRYQKTDVLNAVEASLSRHALSFDKVFLVKDEGALLPLSNTVLRALPEESLMNLPVYDKSGQQVGTFAGSYTFERMGEISGTMQKHALFQYTDKAGKIRSSSDRLLLDSFGIPWKEARTQPGFRLTSDKLITKH